MDLETAANELYALSPDDFIARRQQLVAEARQAQDRQLATQIGKLRRPTRSAWLINLLARQEPDEVTALLELGAALQEAQQRMAGDELRQLSVQRRKTVDALARRAVELGRERGYSAPDGATQEVSQTLQTALGDAELADLVRTGTLTQAVTYGGFGPTDLASALGASLPKQTTRQPERSRRRPSRLPRWIRSNAAKPRKRLLRPGSERGWRVRLPRQRSRRPRRLPSTRMSWPTRSSRCAASCAKPKPPSGRRGRRPEARGSTTRSCGKPRFQPSRRQSRQSRPSMSEG